MMQPPCNRDEHGSYDEALECVRRRHRERMAARDPEQWRADCERLMRLDEPEPLPAPEPEQPEPLPEYQRAQFVEALAVDEEFRGAVRAWVGGAA
uniref:Uncharacterized protein n=1 Tax=Schlesneria paludicola TaxID=360056 RepID=A0A7C2K0J5_9PLAN